MIHKGRRKHALEFVAIKSTAKSMRQQLMEEIRLLHAINHENVVRFHSWYETGNHLWVVSEFCAGGSLRQLLGQDGALPESTVLSLGLDVLAALERVHQEGYAMVQLEPEGILMTEYGIGKLSRFRKARPFGERPTEDEVTALRTSSARAARVHTPPARPQRHPLGPAHGLGASRRALSSLRGARALARRCQVRRVLGRVVVWQPAARARHRQACIRPPPCAFPAPHGAPRVSNGRAYAMPEDDLEGVPPPEFVTSAVLTELLVALLSHDPDSRPRVDELAAHRFWRLYDAAAAERAALEGEGAFGEGATTAESGREAGDDGAWSTEWATGAQPPVEAVEDGGGAPPSPLEAIVTAVTAVTPPEATPREADETRAGGGRGRREQASFEEAAAQDGSCASCGVEEARETTVEPTGAVTAEAAVEVTEAAAAAAKAEVAAAEAVGRLQAALSTLEGGRGARVDEGAALRQRISALSPLLFPPDEMVVRPVFLNPAIERVEVADFEPRALPFSAQPAAELLALDIPQLERQLGELQASICGPTPPAEKTNSLLYLQSLATDALMASLLVNSGTLVVGWWWWAGGGGLVVVGGRTLWIPTALLLPASGTPSTPTVAARTMQASARRLRCWRATRRAARSNITS